MLYRPLETSMKMCEKEKKISHIYLKPPILQRLPFHGKLNSHLEIPAHSDSYCLPSVPCRHALSLCHTFTCRSALLLKGVVGHLLILLSELELGLLQHCVGWRFKRNSVLDSESSCICSGIILSINQLFDVAALAFMFHTLKTVMNEVIVESSACKFNIGIL